MRKLIPWEQIEAGELLSSGEQPTYQVPGLGLVWIAPRTTKKIREADLEAKPWLVAWEVRDAERSFWIVADLEIEDE